MILDSEALFSDDQAITADASSTNSLKLPANAAVGNPIPIVIQVTEDFATLTNLTVSVETDDNSAFSSADTQVSTAAIAAASLVEGYKFTIHYMPRGNEAYVRLDYNVGGSNATAGKITAGIVFDDQTAKNTYPV